jgi:PAS domain S-box-containing protein
MPATPLDLLIVEDSRTDAELMIRQLRREGFEPLARIVDSEAAYLAALEHSPQVILCDHGMPEFDGMRALTLLKGRPREIPVIMVTGKLDDDSAAALMRAGAADYLLKDRLARLGSAVRRALEEQRERAERRRMHGEIERLAAIVEHSNDAIVSRSLDRKILSWNAAAERLFGYTAAEVIGRNISLIIPPDGEAQAAQKRALLKENHPVAPYDAVRLTKDHRRIDVSVTQSPINDSNGG